MLERLRHRRRKPDDVVTGPPDFIGVGTYLSGTRWWHRSLLQHPRIGPARDRRRTLHFFEQFCTREMTDADVAAYHAWFPRTPGTIVGEWTPRYVYDAWTPLLLRRAAPDAKLLMLVSDPIERYRNRLAQELADAESDEDQLFMADAAGRSRYALQLRNLLRHFDAEQVLVLQYEQCLRDPAGQYVRTLRFLGVRDDRLPVQMRAVRDGGGALAYVRFRRALGLLRRRVRGTPAGETDDAPRAELWPDLELSLRADLEPDVRELKAMVPDLDLALWPDFAHLADGR